MSGLPFFALLPALFLSGCSIFVKPPMQEVKGSNVVCIIFNDTRFKTEVVKDISENLSKKGYKVVTDKVKRSKYYDSTKGLIVSHIFAGYLPDRNRNRPILKYQPMRCRLSPK